MRRSSCTGAWLPIYLYNLQTGPQGLYFVVKESTICFAELETARPTATVPACAAEIQRVAFTSRSLRRGPFW
jgi:hypothetical protein